VLQDEKSNARYEIQFRSLHAARQLPSWLTSDVRQRESSRMNTKTLTGRSVAAYAAAVLVLAVGLYFGCAFDGLLGRNAMRLLTFAGVGLVAASTSHWGKVSGFPIRSEERGFSFEFLLRNVVMTALVLVMLSIIATPVWAFIFWLAGKL